MASCIALMLPLPFITWMRFVGWLVVGLIIYFAYSMRRSRMNRPAAS
jgi:APA family basic amino acid/polyamine antiporter